MAFFSKFDYLCFGVVVDYVFCVIGGVVVVDGEMVNKLAIIFEHPREDGLLVPAHGIIVDDGLGDMVDFFVET
jgi:hypothetical protein